MKADESSPPAFEHNLKWLEWLHAWYLIGVTCQLACATSITRDMEKR